MLRRIAVVMTTLLALAGCGQDDSHDTSPESTSTTADQPSSTQSDAPTTSPCEEPVDEPDLGFYACVDLSSFSAYCADPDPSDPCSLPMLPTAELTSGISLTTDYPLGGDQVWVECQVWSAEDQDPITNMFGQESNIWNKVRIPHDRVQIFDKVGGWTTDDFESIPDGSGFYAYASDMWLGDRGMQVLC